MCFLCGIFFLSSFHLHSDAFAVFASSFPRYVCNIYNVKINNFLLLSILCDFFSFYLFSFAFTFSLDKTVLLFLVSIAIFDYPFGCDSNYKLCAMICKKKNFFVKDFDRLLNFCWNNQRRSVDVEYYKWSEREESEKKPTKGLTLILNVLYIMNVSIYSDRNE